MSCRREPQFSSTPSHLVSSLSHGERAGAAPSTSHVSSPLVHFGVISRVAVVVRKKEKESSDMETVSQAPHTASAIMMSETRQKNPRAAKLLTDISMRNPDSDPCRAPKKLR